MSARNAFQELGRLKRALKMADLLLASGIPSSAAELMDDRNWRQLAAAADIEPPKAETRLMTIERLKATEAALNSLHERTKTA